MRDKVGLEATGVWWARMRLLRRRGRGPQRGRGGCDSVRGKLAPEVQELPALLAALRQLLSGP